MELSRSTELAPKPQNRTFFTLPTMQSRRIISLDPILDDFGLHGVRVAIRSAFYLSKKNVGPTNHTPLPLFLSLFSLTRSLTLPLSLSLLSIILCHTLLMGRRQAGDMERQRRRVTRRRRQREQGRRRGGGMRRRPLNTTSTPFSLSLSF